MEHRFSYWAIMAVVIVPFTYYLITSFLLYLRRSRIIRENACRPLKSSSNLPNFINGLFEIRKTFACIAKGTYMDWLAEGHRMHGQTFAAPDLIGTVIQTADPEIIKAIVATHFHDFVIPTARHQLTHKVIGSGISNSEGADWRRSRDSLRPSFNRADVGDLPMLERYVAQLMSLLPADGTTVDLRPLFFRLASDASAEFLLGRSVGSLDPEQDGAVAGWFPALNDVLIGMVQPLRRGLLRSILTKDKKWHANLDFVFHVIDGLVAEAVAQHKADPEKTTTDGHHTLLHSLAAQMPDDPLRIRYELISVMIAGRDGTATLLTNVWQVLPQHPALLARLRDEIAFLDGKPPSYEQLKNLRLLHWTLNESLRLHPVAPGNMRSATRDVVIPTSSSGPVLIRAGQTVLWNMHVLHRLPEVYGADALDFNPDRWESLRPGWAFVPFHGGPRMCIGQGLALAEAAYTTVRLLQGFGSIESRDPEPWREEMGGTLVSRNGAKVALRV